MTTAKINALVNYQKDINNDMAIYKKLLESRVSSAKSYITKGTLDSLNGRIELILNAITVGVNPIKNVRGVIRSFNDRGNAIYIMKKGTIKLIKDRSIINVGKILLTDEQLLILERFFDGINSDCETSYFIKSMINQLRFVEDTYKNLDAFEFIVKSIIGGIIILKTEALSNKNTLELKRACRGDGLDFKELCKRENLLIAS